MKGKKTMTQKQTNTHPELPMLITVKDAQKMGITKNGFYAIAHDHSELTVGIRGRLYLKRDQLLSWINLGGDLKLGKECA